MGVIAGAGPLWLPASLCTLIFSTSGRFKGTKPSVAVVIVAGTGVPRAASLARKCHRRSRFALGVPHSRFLSETPPFPSSVGHRRVRRRGGRHTLVHWDSFIGLPPLNLHPAAPESALPSTFPQLLAAISPQFEWTSRLRHSSCSASHAAGSSVLAQFARTVNLLQITRGSPVLAQLQAACWNVDLLQIRVQSRWTYRIAAE